MVPDQCQPGRWREVVLERLELNRMPFPTVLACARRSTIAVIDGVLVYRGEVTAEKLGGGTDVNLALAMPGTCRPGKSLATAS